ncbi:MAG: tRNA (adenosine(37)-N6)-dimethylallyltransferase MiaA [Flavobacteriales bacterium]|jgi:tRNA dimethylallyltransferase|tara:strand:- start:1174 stop:2076 length:903 start_codon:yes stop_codon:yes gene_type:complete
MKKTLITISGPTAVGKTKFSIELAKSLGCEIISCDSRQFYKEMNIGTGVPTKTELSSIKHHCIQHKSILDRYTISDFEIESNEILNNKFKTHDFMIMVGGSGLYMDASINGLDRFPEINLNVRDELNNQYDSMGIEFLQNKLKKLDPYYYSIIDVCNYRRIIRALEVSISTNKPYSSYLNKKNVIRPYKVFQIAINIERKDLYQLINNRVDQMITNGLLNEVKKLENHKSLTALQTVGYKELFEYINSEKSLEHYIEEIKKNTRRYAKRQLTWLNKKDNLFWIDNNYKIEKIISTYFESK